MRSGTLNVSAIVGFGKASQLADVRQKSDFLKTNALRNELETRIEQLGDVKVNGKVESRIPNTTNIQIKGVEADLFLARTKKQLAIATGSACTSEVIEPSHVLKAMGLNDQEANSSFRFSLGRNTTKEELEKAVKVISEEVKNIRKIQHSLA